MDETAYSLLLNKNILKFSKKCWTTTKYVHSTCPPFNVRCLYLAWQLKDAGCLESPTDKVVTACERTANSLLKGRQLSTRTIHVCQQKHQAHICIAFLSRYKYLNVRLKWVSYKILKVLLLLTLTSMRTHYWFHQRKMAICFLKVEDDNKTLP